MIAVVTSGHKPDDERVYHKEIQSLLNAGYAVDYFTRWDGDSDLSGKNLHHQNFKRSSTPIKKYIQILEQKIGQEHSLLHIHEFDMLPLAKRLKKKHDIKVIYDVHDSLRAMWDTFSSKKGFMKKVINRSLSFFETSHLMYVDEVILANRVIGKNFYDEKGLSTTIVENFPSITHISDKKELIDEPVIIYQGQISEDRGITLLIKAFDRVKESIPKAKLHILGTARTERFKSFLSTIIKDSQHSLDIVWKGEVTHIEVWNHLQNAHIGVVPSLATPRVLTDTPTKLFEYMAAGCVVVATDVAPVKQFLEESGELVQPNDVISLGDGIINVLSDKNKFETYSIKGQAQIRDKYNWEEIESKLLAIYKKLTK